MSVQLYVGGDPASYIFRRHIADKVGSLESDKEKAQIWKCSQTAPSSGHSKSFDRECW